MILRLISLYALTFRVHARPRLMAPAQGRYCCLYNRKQCNNISSFCIHFLMKFVVTSSSRMTFITVTFIRRLHILSHNNHVLYLLTPWKYISNLKNVSYICYGLSSWALLEKLLSCKCHRKHLMIS